MQDHNVLDEWQEDRPEPSGGQFRRAWRFLLYAVGIGLVVGGRIMFSIQQSAATGGPTFQVDEVNRLFLVGIAGCWMFSGLGLSALYRARTERPTDLVFALVAVGHLAVFVLSSFYLLRSFRYLFGS